MSNFLRFSAKKFSDLGFDGLEQPGAAKSNQERPEQQSAAAIRSEKEMPTVAIGSERTQVFKRSLGRLQLC